MYGFLSLQESYDPWMFWRLQPIETVPRMPVLVLHCPPDIFVIFRLQLFPLRPDLWHLSETWHGGTLEQSSVGMVYFSKHGSWTKILKYSCLQRHLRNRWYFGVPACSLLYRLPDGVGEYDWHLYAYVPAAGTTKQHTSGVLGVVSWMEAVSEWRMSEMLSLPGWAACGVHSVSKHLVKHTWLPSTVLGRKYTKINKLKSLGGDNLVGRWIKNQVIEIE